MQYEPNEYNHGSQNSKFRHSRWVTDMRQVDILIVTFVCHTRHANIEGSLSCSSFSSGCHCTSSSGIRITSAATRSASCSYLSSGWPIFSLAWIILQPLGCLSPAAGLKEDESASLYLFAFFEHYAKTTRYFFVEKFANDFVFCNTN